MLCCAASGSFCAHATYDEPSFHMRYLILFSNVAANFPHHCIMAHSTCHYVACHMPHTAYHMPHLYVSVCMRKCHDSASSSWVVPHTRCIASSPLQRGISFLLAAIQCAHFASTSWIVLLLLLLLFLRRHWRALAAVLRYARTQLCHTQAAVAIVACHTLYVLF